MLILLRPLRDTSFQHGIVPAAISPEAQVVDVTPQKAGYRVSLLAFALFGAVPKSGY